MRKIYRVYHILNVIHYFYVSIRSSIKICLKNCLFGRLACLKKNKILIIYRVFYLRKYTELYLQVIHIYYGYSIFSGSVNFNSSSLTEQNGRAQT